MAQYRKPQRQLKETAPPTFTYEENSIHLDREGYEIPKTSQTKVSFREQWMETIVGWQLNYIIIVHNLQVKKNSLPLSSDVELYSLPWLIVSILGWAKWVVDHLGCASLRVVLLWRVCGHEWNDGSLSQQADLSLVARTDVCVYSLLSYEDRYGQ